MDENTLYVKDNASGQYGTIDIKDYNPSKYTSVPPSEALANKPASNTPAAPQHADLLNKVSGLAGSIFPGSKIGESIGTLGGYGLAAAHDYFNHLQGNETHLAKNYDLSSPSPLQVMGDTVAAGAGALLPAAGGALGGAALSGALALGSKVASGSTDPGSIAASTAGGAVLGGATIGAGNVLGKVLSKLPARIAQKALSGADPETAQYALQKSIGPVSKLLAESKAATQSGHAQIQAALSHPDHAGKLVNGETILGDVLKQLPASEHTPQSLQQTLLKLVPNQSSLVKKLFTGEGLPLKEANSLRSKLDNAVKGVYVLGQKIDAPAISANKEVGATVASAIRNDVKSQAKETVPMFDSLMKEIRLRNALGKTQGKLDKKAAVGLYDILSGIAGFTAAGPIGAAATYVGEKALRSPGVELGAAKILSKTLPNTQKVVGAVTKAAKAPVIRGLTQ